MAGPSNSMAMDPLSMSPIYEEQKKLERRKALLAALAGNSQQVPAQYYRPLNALADMSSKLLSAYGQSKIAEQEAGLRGRYRDEGMAKQKEFRDAWLKGDRAGMLTAMDGLAPYKEQYEMAGRMMDWATPKADIKTVDGNLVETGPGGVQNLGYGGQTYTQLPSLPGGAPVQQSNQSGKRDYGPQTPVGPFTGAGQHEIVQRNVKWLDDNRDKVIGSPQRMLELSKATRLVSDGVLKGNLAGVGQFFAQMGHSLGIPLAPENANLETMKTTLAPLVLERVRALAPVTQIDAEKVEQMVGSDPTKMSDEALVELFNIFAWQTETFGQEYNRINEVNSKLMTGPASQELLQSAFPKFAPPKFGGAGGPPAAAGGGAAPKRVRLNEDGTLTPVGPQ